MMKHTPIKTEQQNTIYKVGWLFERNTPPPKTSEECVYLTGGFTKGQDSMARENTPQNGYISKVG